MRGLNRGASVFLLTVFLAGCSPFYVIRAGYEEAKILSRRQSIPAVVQDTTAPPAVRAKLSLVLAAREHADSVLGLDAGDSYTTYSRLDSDTLALVLSAAHKDRFEPFTWWFPIVGSVPYKGYFSERKAMSAAESLSDKGFDVHVRPTSAFSTLGWFNDPLVSPLLRYDSVSLATTVIHELLHNSIYLGGQATFNESFAEFVGGRGAIDFFCGRYGETSALCERAEAAWMDQRVFGAFLDAMIGELETIYEDPELTREQKIELREAVFTRARSTFATEVQPRLRVLSYRSFLEQPLNNATLISRRLYYHRLDLFDAVYRSTGGDLPRTIRLVIEAAEARDDDPYGAVEDLLRSDETARAEESSRVGRGL